MIKCFLVEPVEKGYKLESGDVVNYANLPPGAMFYADDDWAKNTGCIGPDGRCLVVKTPEGFWYIDSQAGNCTRKGDRSHKCWVRHGEPPNITVDKNGETCGCGHSIGMPWPEMRFHAFLTDGELREC